jgi:hypothetical protein
MGSAVEGEPAALAAEVRGSPNDPRCVKTPETRKPGETFSQITRNLPRSETVVALMVIRKDSCSINFPRRRVFTQPRPEPDFQVIAED